MSRVLNLHFLKESCPNVENTLLLMIVINSNFIRKHWLGSSTVNQRSMVNSVCITNIYVVNIHVSKYILHQLLTNDLPKIPQVYPCGV